MLILGISEGHESHACLIKSGKLLAAVAEERFSRIKTDCGYPKTAIEKVFEITGISKSNVDIVAMAGEKMEFFGTLLKRQGIFSVDDWILENENYWKPILLEGKKLSLEFHFNFFKNKINDLETNPYYPFLSEIKKNNLNSKNIQENFNKFRKKIVREQIGIDEKKIVFIRHEDCHKFYGYFSQPSFIDNVLLFTLEGKGDDSSATVSIAKNNKIQEVYKTNDSNLGRLYRYITLLLGMKPCQHEYKVMGLAPYGTEFHGMRSLEHFRTFDLIKNTEIVNQKKHKDVYYSSRKILEGQRFDGIAWGLQKYTEEYMEKWILNNVKKFKINNIVISGGVAQNIKAMQVIKDNPLINSVWAGPISGDGSLAIGAAWAVASKFPDNINGIESIYLGTKINDNDIKKSLAHISNKYDVIDNYKIKDVAKWIFEGKILARCEGRMEFGQRALGNRSILADPRKFDTVERINKKIKYRDFWMPFTPSICYEGCDNYLENNKQVYSPFMTMAFDLKEEMSSNLPAVIHPADKTCRPQMLKRHDNPEYYDIIKEFEKLSGHPVLLNTSFNLHGDAIVESASQAIETFEQSDIDILLLGGKAIIRTFRK